MQLRRAGLLTFLTAGLVAVSVGTAPAVLGSPSPVSVGAGGAAPASATFSGGPINGTGDGGGLTGAPASCDAASSCEPVTIHLLAPSSFAAANNLKLTTTVTFSALPGAGLDTFLLDSHGTTLAQNTSSTSPSVIKADKLAPGDYQLDVVGDVGIDTSYAGKAEVTTTPKTTSANPGALPAQLTFAPSTVVSPIILGQEPQISFERPQPNSIPGQVRATRGFIDWPVSSRTGIGTIWRTLNGGNSYRQVIDMDCAFKQRPNCATQGGGDTVNRVNNYDGKVMFGDQESLAAEAYVQSTDHGDTFPVTSTQDVTAAGSGVDRQWISAVDAPGFMSGPTDKFEMEGVFSYHIPAAGQYVSGIDKSGLVHPALVTTVSDVGQSGPSRIDTTGGPANGYFYQSYRGFLNAGTKVAVVPLNQYQDSSKYKVHTITTDSAVVFPWIALDRAGNLYAIWISPADGNLYMKYSLVHDRANDPTRGGSPGTLWSKQVRVNPPPLASTIFPEIVAGDPGRVAITYMSTPDYAGASSSAPKTARWWTWVSETTNAFDASPTWQTGPVSHRVAHVGPICTNGTTCVGQQDRSLADMIDLTMDADGRPSVVYENNNNTFAVQETSLNQEGSPYTMFSKLSQGPSLLANHADINITYPAGTRESARDDATWPNTAAGVHLPALDIVEAGVAEDGKNMVATVRLAEGSGAAMTRDLAAYNAARVTDVPSSRLQYVVRFETAKDVFYMAMEHDSGGVRRAYGGRVDASNAILNGSSAIGTNYDAQAAYPMTYSVAGNTITLTAPMAEFGLVPGSTLFSFTAFSLASPSSQSLGAFTQDGNSLSIPRVIDASYAMDAVVGTATTGPPPGAGTNGPTINPGPARDQLPDTSSAPSPFDAVPVAALLGGVGLVGWRRRRRTARKA